jgi:Cu/Ag efflux protein CusF
MKRLATRWQFILALAALATAMVLPAEAARLRRVPVVQTETFLVASNATIAVGTNRKAALADLKVGDKVGISYDQGNGGWVAHHISDGVPHKPRNPGSKPSTTPHPHPKTSSLAHAHGVIQSVDVQGRTVTIAHRLK